MIPGFRALRGPGKSIHCSDLPGKAGSQRENQQQGAQLLGFKWNFGSDSGFLGRPGLKHRRSRINYPAFHGICSFYCHRKHMLEAICFLIPALPWLLGKKKLPAHFPPRKQEVIINIPK